MERCVFCMSAIDGDVCGHCGKSASSYIPASHHLIPGTILNKRYSVGAVLGEGGFGITYIGIDTVLDMKVAIKEYFPSGIVNRNNTSSTEITAHVGSVDDNFEKGKKRFLEEARTLAAFSGEINIVSVKDFFAENNTVYIVMEYLEGTDLKCYLDKNGVMTFANAFNMLCPVLNSLSKIHEKGLIHRDISPSNIMVLNNGIIKLLDFGAARNIGGMDQKSLSIMLKPGFAPEEQYRSKGYQGPWTDIYALSATMYKMITGIIPDDAMNRLYKDELKAPSELNKNITPAQDAVILKGLAIRQENRYQSISEFLEACRQALSQASAAPHNSYSSSGYAEQQAIKLRVSCPECNSSFAISVKAPNAPWHTKCEKCGAEFTDKGTVCPHCHAVNKNKAKFCCFCGSQMSTKQSSAKKAGQNQSDTSVGKTAGKSKGLFWLYLVLSVFTLGIGNMILLLIRKKNDKSKWKHIIFYLVWAVIFIILKVALADADTELFTIFDFLSMDITIEWLDIIFLLPLIGNAFFI